MVGIHFEENESLRKKEIHLLNETSRNIVLSISSLEHLYEGNIEELDKTLLSLLEIELATRIAINGDLHDQSMPENIIAIITKSTNFRKRFVQNNMQSLNEKNILDAIIKNKKIEKMNKNEGHP